MNSKTCRHMYTCTCLSVHFSFLQSLFWAGRSGLLRWTCRTRESKARATISLPCVMFMGQGGKLFLKLWAMVTFLWELESKEEESRKCGYLSVRPSYSWAVISHHPLYWSIFSISMYKMELNGLLGLLWASNGNIHILCWAQFQAQID